jgi:NAD(P)-dependent dehydrogenase (short-subunit alcohol dehydrogenase family)
MALDYAARGIRFNCVCPATIENTRMDAISAARALDP